MLKSYRKPNMYQNKAVRDRNGLVLRDEQEIMERWKEYFMELLDVEGNKEEDNKDVKQESEEEETDEQITKEELEWVLKELKNGKAPGEDKITTEMLKYMGSQGRDVFLHILKQAWQEESLPKDWQAALIVPIYKKGDKKTVIIIEVSHS